MISPPSLSSLSSPSSTTSGAGSTDAAKSINKMTNFSIAAIMNKNSEAQAGKKQEHFDVNRARRNALLERPVPFKINQKFHSLGKS